MAEGEPAKKGPLPSGWMYVCALFCWCPCKEMARPLYDGREMSGLIAQHCWNTYSKTVRCDSISTTPRDESTKKEEKEQNNKVD